MSSKEINSTCNICIVAGNAWTLHKDLEKAGDYPVIAVNGAAKEVKAFALYSHHPERFVALHWIHWQRRNFGDGFTVNAPGSGDLPYIDHWWPVKRTGGSAWGARKVAKLMGFKKVILCGCPMEAGPYVGNHGLGGLMHRPEVVDNLFSQIEKDKEWHEGCISMSGRTKALLCSL